MDLRNWWHIITTEPAEADLYYSNDPVGFSEAISYSTLNDKVVLILNIQDCPTHISNYTEWKDKTAMYLKSADVVTCISESTKLKVEREFGIVER